MPLTAGKQRDKMPSDLCRMCFLLPLHRNVSVGAREVVITSTCNEIWLEFWPNSISRAGWLHFLRWTFYFLFYFYRTTYLMWQNEPRWHRICGVSNIFYCLFFGMYIMCVLLAVTLVSLAWDFATPLGNVTFGQTRFWFRQHWRTKIKLNTILL